MRSVWLGEVDAEAVVTDALRDGECPAREVQALAAARGIPWKNVWRAAQRLGVRRRRVGFGPGSVMLWFPPA